MEGPVPVSALIHAATLVMLGIVLLWKIYDLVNVKRFVFGFVLGILLWVFDYGSV